MCATTNTKAVYGICSDVHNEHRLASYFENQVISVSEILCNMIFLPCVVKVHAVSI